MKPTSRGPSQWLLPWLTAVSLSGTAARAEAPAGPHGRARVDVQIQLQTGEASLEQSVEARVSATDGAALDFDQSPLLLPLLAPAVSGGVLDHGVVPQSAQTVEAEAAPPLRVERKDGGLWLRGQVARGTVGVVRARTVIGVRRAQLALGLRGVGERTWATVVVLAAAPARVQLAVDRPARVSVVEQGSERLVGAALAQPLGYDEVAVFTVTDLPLAARAPQHALAVLAIVAVALAVWWMGLRRGSVAGGDDG